MTVTSKHITLVLLYNNDISIIIFITTPRGSYYYPLVQIRNPRCRFTTDYRLQSNECQRKGPDAGMLTSVQGWVTAPQWVTQASRLQRRLPGPCLSPPSSCSPLMLIDSTLCQILPWKINTSKSKTMGLPLHCRHSKGSNLQPPWISKGQTRSHLECRHCAKHITNII